MLVISKSSEFWEAVLERSSVHIGIVVEIVKLKFDYVVAGSEFAG